MNHFAQKELEEKYQDRYNNTTDPVVRDDIESSYRRDSQRLREASWMSNNNQRELSSSMGNSNYVFGRGIRGEHF